MILKRDTHSLLSILVGTMVLTVSITASTRACAQDTLGSASPPTQWTVLTEIYQGDASRPAETHRIALKDGIYYDFPKAAGEPWTIFDLPQSRVILLDRNNQQRTSIPTDDLVSLTAQAEAGVTDAAQRARFGMDAQPIQTSQTQFSLDYEDTQYLVTGVHTSDPDVVAQYGRFVDWACRLNIARPRGVPPFARMKLNELMTRQSILPYETSVTLTRHVGVERTTATIRLRSTTALHREIDESLAAQIQDAQTMRVVFEEVPWDQYEH